MRSKMMMTCCVGLFLLLNVGAAVTHATVPDQINYQGYLTDTDGSPVPDGTYTMTFSLYDAFEGGNLNYALFSAMTF